MRKYIPTEIEPKWQKSWKEAGQYRVDLSKPFDSKDSQGKKYYLLVEFTYPSGDLHMGHWFAFAVPDILARLKRMQGYMVFAPNGFDAFGLPAENAAIQRKIHPRDWTYDNIKRMKQQFATMGAIYDWEHEVITCDPEYYKWNQWIFLKMFEKGLAYRGKTLSNWCPKDQTVLANENVENGRCWRCGTEVVQKEVEQWFLKITDYAERLIWQDKSEGPERSRGTEVDWPKSLKEGQNNWIGKSEGLLFTAPVKDSNLTVQTFSAHFEAFYADTFVVIAPDHPFLEKLIEDEPNKKEIKIFADKLVAKRKGDKDFGSREPEGIFTGKYIVDPIGNGDLPIWVASYALKDYGTGIVKCSVHDERDFAFAKKYGLKLKPVLFPEDPELKKKVEKLEVCYTDMKNGILSEPEDFKGKRAGDVKKEIIEYAVKKSFAKKSTQYHLHDWSVSRQRYWGTPIPIIHCDNCGIVPVPEKDLPVELPYKLSLRSSSSKTRTAGLDVDFAPRGKPPLATAEDWVRVKCPNCGGEARREVETMDTFFDSSWYFLRYLDSRNKREPFDKLRALAWMPVDIYFGGAEHTLGHTLYSRFFVKFLQDIGVVPQMEEYAQKRVHHGVILGPDGQRMSKSHGNVVNPDDEVKQYGADAVRLYLAFLGPYDLVAPWDPGGIRGVYNFLQRTWRLADSVGNSKFEIRNSKLSGKDLFWMHKTIKKVSEDVENIKFNTGVSTLMQWLNHLSVKAHNGKISRLEYLTFLKLLAPFAPHITEELWQMMGEEDSIHNQLWPKFDPELVQAKQITLVVQVNGKVREKLLVEAGTSQKDAEKLALASDKVQKFLGNEKPHKIIFIKDRLVNLVV